MITSTSIMYDKIRKKYPHDTSKCLFVCNSTVQAGSCKTHVVVFFIICFSLISSSSYSQSVLISLQNMNKSMSFEAFIQEVESQTKLSFVYNPDKLAGIQLQIPGGEELHLEALLAAVFSPLGFSFILYRDKIIIKEQSGAVPMTKLKSSSLIQMKNIQRMEKVVLGRILCDDDSQPIVGASVRVKNEFIGIASDKDGYYTLKCLLGDTIVVSAIGFVKQEIVVGLKMIEDVRLEADVVNLQEVNVIGYGEEVKEEQIGAMSSISTSMSGEIPNDFDEALGGTASGLWFQKSSGIPGAASTIAIRGVTSLQPDANSPLVVVDGVPLFSSDESFNNITFQSFSGGDFLSLADNYIYNDIQEADYFQKNGFNMINPEDIESISVLKDAYSTSIYGSRGAAGVILIESKKPKKYGLKVNLLLEGSVSNPIEKPNLMNGEEYAQFYSNYYSQLKNEEVVFPSGINTDWYDLVVRTAKGNKLNLSLQNKKHNGYLYFSFSQLNQESYIVGSDYKRYTGRFNFRHNINERFHVGTNLSMASVKNNSLLAPKIYRDAILKAPNVPAYNAKGEFTFNNEGNPYGKYSENPLAMALSDKGEVVDNYIITNVYAGVEITKWLTYRFDFGIDLIDTDAISAYRNSNSPSKKLSIESDGYSRKWIITNTIDGTRSFNEHYFKFVLGQSFEQSRQKEDQLLYENLWEFARKDGNTLLDFKTDKRKYALASWFGRLNYNYKKTLFLGLSYRVDGSSRFNEDNRYQIFPAFSLGWIVKKDDENSYLSLLKLRSSFGYSGVEQSTFTYGALRTYTLQQKDLTYGKTPILVETNGSNLNISWEKTKNFDLGIDFSWFRNHLQGSIDYYQKQVNNLLLYTDVVAVSGYTKQWVNVGAMKNSGIEFSMDSKLINRDLKWDLAITAAYNKNKVIKLNQAGYQVWGQDQAYKYFEEGKEAAQFYLYDWAGVNPDTGNPMWRYANGTLSEEPPHGNDENRKVFGSGIPKYTGGISNKLQYKGVELTAFLVFAEAKKLINGTAAILHTYTTTDTYNLSPNVARYWKHKGDVTNQPALFNQSITSQNNYTTSRTSSRFYEDASFIRLKKLVLAYYFPKKIVNSLKFDEIKIFAQASNLFTITNYSGSDPEVSAFGSSSLLSGYDEVSMPQTKTFSLGIRISL